MTAVEVGQAIIDNAPYLAGFILPPFIEVLNREVETEEERYVVAVLVCFLISVIIHWNAIANGDPLRFMTYVGLIFMESNSLFKLYFANSWIRGRIQRGMGVEVQSEVEQRTPGVPVI